MKSTTKNTIQVFDRTGKAGTLVPVCKEILRASLKHLNLKKHEVHLTLVSDAAMKKLNFRYRRKNQPTDVLSFDQGVRLPSGILHLGDIIIATPTARRQAKAAGRELRSEFGMLAIHGLLHLLGHDHQLPHEAKKMFTLQNRLCAKVKIDV